MKIKKNFISFFFPIKWGRSLFLYVTFILIYIVLSNNALYSQSRIKKPATGALFLTEEEYSKLPRPNRDTLLKYSNLKVLSLKSSKSIVNLITPPIGDQGQQGSCTGWASGYAALGILTYPKYNCWDQALRSPSYVFNQIKLSECNLAYLSAAIKLVVQQGSCSWNLMPYYEPSCSAQPNSVQRFDASKHNAATYYAINRTDLTQIKEALDLGYPVPSGIKVYDSFYDCWFDDGIWDTADSGEFYGGHAVCIIGYDDVQQMLKVQNSWGDIFGDDGFFWIPYSKVQNGGLQEAYIIYGMDPSYPESISGQNTLCTYNSQYSVNYIPTGCSITWNCSNNITRVSSQGSNPCAFQGSGSGSGWIEATLITSCSTNCTLERLNIQVNPSINFIDADYQQDCNTIDLTAEIPSYTTVTWNGSSNFLLDGNSPPFTKQGNSITVTSIDGQGGTVYGTTDIGCSITQYSGFCPCLPWDASITWLWPNPTPGEPLVAEVSPLYQDAYEYKWYIGNELVETTYDGYLQTYNWHCTSQMPHLYVSAVTSCGHTVLIDGGEFFPYCSKMGSNVRIYPNPSSSQLTIKTEDIYTENKNPNILPRIILSCISQIKIIDKIGIIKMSLTFGEGNNMITLNISELPSDSYILYVSDGSRSASVPFVVSKK